MTKHTPGKDDTKECENCHGTGEFTAFMPSTGHSWTMTCDCEAGKRLEAAKPRENNMSEDNFIQIDKGVPIPPDGRTKKKCLFPFEAMEIGDSFFTVVKQSYAAAASNRYALENNKKFTRRKVVENGISGTRVWRVE